MANTVKDNLNKLPTKTIMQIFQRSGVSDLTEYSLDNAIRVVNGELDKHKNNPEQSNITKTGEQLEGETPHGYMLGTKEEKIEGIREFLEEYLSELNWTKSQILVTGGESKVPYYTSNLIYKLVENKRVLATPEVLPDLIERVYHDGELRGYKGIIVVNLSGRIVGRASWNVEQHLEQELMRNSFFRTKPEGKVLYEKKVMSKQVYLEQAYNYSRPTQQRNTVPKDGDRIVYLAYLSQLFPYRNTNILAEKTQTFMSVLKQHDEAEVQRLANDPVFRKTRIYEEDGYTLILRSRFVLIDSIRNQVIINKTPTNMAKKDIELMVRLLTSH